MNHRSYTVPDSALVCTTSVCASERAQRTTDSREHELTGYDGRSNVSPWLRYRALLLRRCSVADIAERSWRARELVPRLILHVGLAGIERSMHWQEFGRYR